MREAGVGSFPLALVLPLAGLGLVLLARDRAPAAARQAEP
jgi:hypothetical protein